MLHSITPYYKKKTSKDTGQSQGTFCNRVLHVPVQFLIHFAEADIFRGAHVTG